MKNLSRMGCALALMVAGSWSVQAAIYVDQATGNDDSGTGTAASPYATIQKGVDAAVENDTVYVLPGVYASGSTTDASGNEVRVLISKPLTLVATSFLETGCRTNTVIRGAAATTALDTQGMGLGDDAVRCIRVTASNVHIQGFTIEEGRSRFNNNGNSAEANYAGGVFGTSSSNTFIEDCLVRNCSATRGGAFYNCRVVRCFVTGCNSSNVGACFRNCSVYNSIIARNAVLSGSGIGAYTGNIYNSTIVENNTGVWRDSGAECYNCAIFHTDLGAGAVKDKTFHNCVTDNDWGDFSHEGGAVASYESCLYSPMTNDFRVVAGSALDATGLSSQAHVSDNGGAADFYGQPRVTGTTMNIGAVEAKMAVEADDVVFSPTFNTFAGSTYSAGDQATFGPVIFTAKQTFLREKASARTYPSSFTLTLPNKTTAGNAYVQASCDGTTYWVQIKWDNTVCLPRLPPAADGTDATYGLMTAVYQLHVDRSAGSDETGNGTRSQPFQSIQKAVTTAAAQSQRSVIYVQPGVYDNGGTVVSGYGALTNRVYLVGQNCIRLVAVGGPSQTVIKGAADAVAANGLGPAAVRCVLATVPSGYSHFLSGFTLADGHTAETTADGTSHDLRGGAVYRAYGDNRNLWLNDCVVTNCTSPEAALYNVHLTRCQVVDSQHANFAVVVNGSVINSLFRNCGLTTGGTSTLLGSGVNAYNVTIGTSAQKYAVPGITCQNSVIDTKGGAIDAGSSGGTFKYSLFRSSASTLVTDVGARNEGAVIAPAGFVAAEQGDLRLLSCSKARNLARFETMYKGCPDDVFGRPFVGTADGRFTAGAVEETVLGVAFETTYAGGVSPAEPQRLDTVASLTVTAMAANRPLLGYAVNGTLVATHDRTWTLAKADYPEATAFVVQAVYGTNFWADAVNGKESNSGFYADDAKKYINSALDLTESGDVVVALPGEYAAPEEARTHNATVTIKSRVVVPDGRTVISRDGPATTAIVGAAATSPVRSGFDLGTDAVRCVYLKTNAKVCGFTLKDGNTDAPDTGTAEGSIPEDRRGGGVLGASISSSQLEDCIITNCASVRGGGIYYATCRRCRVVGNRGVHMGTGAYSAHLYRCYADHNNGNQMWMYQGFVEGCTVGAHNFSSGSTRAKLYLEGVTSAFHVFNSIILGGDVFCGGGTNIYNCVFAPEATCSKGTNDNHNCLFNATELAFAADGVTPVPGRNVAIDRGNPDLMEEVDQEADLSGMPHIWNGAYDVGAVESDWRTHYAQSLAPNHLVVKDADPTAVEQDDGRLRLVAGELSAAFVSAQGKRRLYTLAYAVPGTGTLTVCVDGVIVDTVGAGAERKTYTFSSAKAECPVVFTYEPGVADVAGALVGKFAYAGGLVVNFR